MHTNMRKICIAVVVVLLCIAVKYSQANSSIRTSSGLDTNQNHNSAIPDDDENSRPDSFALKYGRILRSDEFERFDKSLQLVQGERCMLDLNATLWGVVHEEQWAVAMYDASAKGISGVENGLVYQFGHYDQCLDLNKHVEADELNGISIRSKYCLAEVKLDGLQIQKMGSRKIRSGNSTIIHWGACIPASCNAKDVGIFLESFLQKSVNVDENMCQIGKHEIIATKEMIIYASVVLFFVTLAMLSTFYHIYQLYVNRNEHKRPRIDTALKAFSIIENLKKLGQSSKDQMGLNAINGIKALAMIFILGGHALSFIYSGPVYNSGFMAENLLQVQNAVLTNSLLFVDIFLFLSGFLFCKILLIELERRRGNVNVAILYVGRYIRLTPSYMAVLGFYMTWFSTMGNGPIWQSTIGLEQERCQQSWWLNILYINNYVGTDNLCMFQSWYLSVDTQLFFFAPIAILFLHKSRRFGFQFLLIVLAVTVAIPFTITYVNKLDPTLMVYADEVQDFASNKFYTGSYIKTHMRATDYVIGILAGFIVHLMQEKNTKIPKLYTKILWVASIVVGTLSMFSITRFYTSPFTVLESSLYAAFHKVGWGLCIGWLVIAVTTGHAVYLQKFLACRVFAPISRLTYCAYLCNGIVELYHASDIRFPHYLSRVDMFHKATMHSLDTFALALIVCLLFESPIHALERILFKTFSKPSQPKGSSSTPSTSEEQIA
ncbi:nose resistant to fluoxetine protein 6-like [Episyrphus balteatus]|uniref:nose resistant to fluoxetine protein 6-like n=1 Tax=Episyrphus balteatus TaxID=286459 RepID=UPI002485D8F2|nr:nose resistant to fluoxetine protein 6-like [Episyrphus balteatus]